MSKYNIDIVSTNQSDANIIHISFDTEEDALFYITDMTENFKWATDREIPMTSMAYLAAAFWNKHIAPTALFYLKVVGPTN